MKNLVSVSLAFVLTSSALFAALNSKPVLGPIAGPVNLIRGVEYEWTGSWTDDAGDTHKVQWNFGDKPVFVQPPFVVATSPTSKKHIYTNVGTYTIRFTVRDQSGGAAFATRTVVVTN